MRHLICREYAKALLGAWWDNSELHPFFNSLDAGYSEGYSSVRVDEMASSHHLGKCVNYLIMAHVAREVSGCGFALREVNTLDSLKQYVKDYYALVRQSYYALPSITNNLTRPFVGQTVIAYKQGGDRAYPVKVTSSCPYRETLTTYSYGVSEAWTWDNKLSIYVGSGSCLLIPPIL